MGVACGGYQICAGDYRYASDACERANVLRTVEAGDRAGSEQDHDAGHHDHVHDKADENGDT